MSDSWKIARKLTISKFRNFADELDTIQLRGSKSNIAGNGASLLDAAIGIPCALLISFTCGSALVGLAVGAIGGAGAVVQVGSSFGQWLHGKIVINNIEEMLENDRREMEHMYAQGGSSVDAHIRSLKMLNGGGKFLAIRTKIATQAATQGADVSLGALSTMSNMGVAVLFSVVLVPFDTYGLMTNSIDVYHYTPHGVAEQVRAYANTLEQELVARL